MALKGSAFATRQNYLRGVKVLIEHYQRVPEDCSVDEIKTYLVYQREQLNIASSTLNVRVCSLKYYFRHIAQRLDLVVKIPNPRVTKYDTEILTESELLRLFKACRDTRQLLIIHLLYDAGLRINEVLRLRASDFEKKDTSIAIRNAKGNKTRVVYYGAQLRRTLLDYAKAIGITNGPLIKSYKNDNKGLSLRGLQHIVSEVIKRAAIDKRVTSHTLRHSFAVHYLNKGGSIFSLKLLLGHSNITTTLSYLRYAKLPDGIRISVLDQLLS